MLDYIYKIYKERIHFSLNFYSVFLLITFVPDFIGLPPSIASYALWTLRGITSFWIIYKYFKPIYLLSWQERLFVFVAGIYLLNILIDIFWQVYPMGMGSIRDLIGFALSILVAVSLRYDPVIVSGRSYYFFLFSLALGLLIAFFVAQPSPLPLVGRFDANSTVNTINYGQMGCALSLIALYGFLNKPFRYGYFVYSIFFLLGIISIMKAGSRSPVVVLLTVSIFYFFAKAGLVKGLMLVVGAALTFYLSLDFIIELSEAVGSSIVTRLLSAIETGETSGRDAIYENAIGHFLDAPIFGNYYLIPSGIAKGYYPHNFVIEALMTTGLVGGIPFLIMMIVCVVKCFILLKRLHPSGWILLLFLQVIIFGMFSSSLYSSQEFWALSFFILSIGNESLSLFKFEDATSKQPLENNLNTV
ncbi:O-antigen ligase family protein [Cytophaga sp. FL35]|uniref:O-antigen ligase family protein n=1 Tax=Cytophaga sp. FL35 TaxID=1904456 RepID=UPI001653CAF1|nr:O-antigen ligase family protein [Cytophaga sp. FL35]MBC6999405.1 O-antigen ligase family protein [Cytophaga sp. FL35]